MKHRQLPDWINGFMEMTRGMMSCDIFLEWSAVSAINAALQRKCWVRVGRHINYPILYVVFVGPSGCGKGTAIGEALPLIEGAGINMTADILAGKGLYDSLSSFAIDTPFAENHSHIKHNVLRHCSAVAIPEEFTSLLERNRPEFLELLCIFYDGKKRSFSDQALSRFTKLPNPCLSILSGTTITSLYDTLPKHAFGGGFSARTIFVYCGRSTKPIDDWIWDERTPGQSYLSEMLTDDLTIIRETAQGEFTWSPAARSAYIKWYKERWRESPKMESEMSVYLDRSRAHGPRVAMSMCMSREDNNMQIELEDFERAVSLLERSEETMPIVFKHLGDNELTAPREKIKNRIVQGGEVWWNDLFARSLNDVSRAQFKECLDDLVTLGVCTKRWVEDKQDYKITAR